MEILSLIPPFLGVIGILLIIGIVSTRISSHFNMPTLLLFLALGMVVGYRTDATITFIGAANFIGTVAMCYILFSGGMDTSFKSVRREMAPGVVLATLGVIVTAGVVGLGAMWLFPDWDWRFAMLLGSVVNTFLAAFGADSILITADGKALQTGHNVYNEPLTVFSDNVAK